MAMSDQDAHGEWALSWGEQGGLDGERSSET